MPPQVPPPEPIDLNILPERYRRRAVPPATIIMGAAAILLFIMLVPAAFLLRTTQAKVTRLAGDLKEAQATLKAVRTPAADVIALGEELTRTLKSVESLKKIQPEIAEGRRDWPTIFDAVLLYDSDRIHLQDVYQDGDYLTLTGLALKQDDVLAYANALDRSQVFEQINVQSMENVAGPFSSPTPTGSLSGTPAPPQPTTPVAGLTATSALTYTVAPVTAAPTRPPIDEFEPDDAQPKPIAPDADEQWHNFTPQGDIDQVVFTGKAGQRYCIQAVPQIAGGNTYIEVTAGGIVYTNDDCISGQMVASGCMCAAAPVTNSFASLVSIQIPQTGDQEVLVKITNRGVYGTDQWYTLQVLGATGDPYEKDDVTPRSINVGDTQQRTFYPDGDIDRVTFPVKAGRAYVITASKLATGVDTVLSALVETAFYQNDDVTSGDPSSRVEFQAPKDGIATVTVTNKGSFGLDKSYLIELREVGGDIYEPDDAVPASISPTQQQRHSFYPEGDVDRLTFNIKAGRLYELKTYSLTLGVDTSITVNANGASYVNDDQVAGERASSVVFNATADGRAEAIISNLDQYGIDRTYMVTLIEQAGTPVAGVTATGAPTYTPTPTPTTSCGDIYEPDDVIPKMIAVGDIQEHTFCPSGDQDRVVFTAKAGYAYQIETTDLATGVDTYLTVQIGSTVYAADDRTPGDLSSSLQVQNSTGADAAAYVIVTNKGLAGSNKVYRLRITTLALGDQYEVDDVNPGAILISSPQNHNFYPGGDVDRLYFIARAGRSYRIYTYNLVAGVDTILTVNLGATQKVSDDRSTTDLSSLVEITNTSSQDAQVIAIVTNKGQFGQDKTYTIQVDDIGGVSSGDAYEPDLTTKRYISVSEVQQHTFYPSLDTDRVTLAVVAGRRYAVYTCGSDMLPSTLPNTTTPFDPVALGCMPLPSSINTMMLVSGMATRCEPSGCQNEDALPGTQYKNSRVEFDATGDGEVTITIYNTSGQFLADAYYYLRVQEVQAITPTPTLSRTPTATLSPTSVIVLSPTPTFTPGGATATPTTPAAPTPTGTIESPSPYPSSLDLLQNKRIGLLAAVVERSTSSQRALAPPQQAQPQPTEQVIRFVILAKIRRTTP